LLPAYVELDLSALNVRPPPQLISLTTGELNTDPDRRGLATGFMESERNLSLGASCAAEPALQIKHMWRPTNVQPC
jgi:hypothetical protein